MKINTTTNYWLNVLLNEVDNWQVDLGPINKAETDYGLTIWTRSNSVEKWKDGKFFCGLVTLQATHDQALNPGKIEGTITINFFDGKPAITKKAPIEIIGQLLEIW